MTWSLGKTVLFRTAIIVGMASVATTIIYLSPVPGQEFISCQRDCNDLEMPMICRVTLLLELVRTSDSALDGCSGNETSRGNPNCDGNNRWVMVANRQLPGPSIHVCQDDILVVDVVNKMSGIETAVHWRGQSVRETPFMDGVPMITQCPIHAGTTFQYKLRATDAGTHLWHALAPPALESDGLVGALIVRQPRVRTPHAALYDRDEVDHVAVISTSTDGRALLVNGLRAPVSSRMSLVSGSRHRLRLVNSVGLQQGGRCSVLVSLDSHVMIVIALDGKPIKQWTATRVELGAGERADVVVLASHPEGGDFSLRVQSACADHVLPGDAVLSYAATTGVATPTLEVPTSDVTLSTRLDAVSCLSRVCLPELRAQHVMNDALRSVNTDVTISLRFKVTDVTTNQSSTLSWGYRRQVPEVNGLTFSSPSTPMLTQPDDAVESRRCSRGRRPPHCVDLEVPCECEHVVDVPLGSSVELLLVDAGLNLTQQVFHLHGHSFHVVGSRTRIPTHDEKDGSVEGEEGELLTRNLLNAVEKDTVTVPRGGEVALRFVADNPGFWLLAAAGEPGFNVVLKVGVTGDVPQTPAAFPRCRGFVGPDFFLI